MDIFSVLPPRLGGLDMLLPIFMEIKRLYSNAKIHVLFMEDRVFSDLSRDPFLSKEFYRIVDSAQRTYKTERTKANFLLSAPALAGFLLKIAKSRKPVLFHSRGGNSRGMKFLRSAVHAKGGRSYMHFSGMALTIGRACRSNGKVNLADDGFICFSEHDVQFLYDYGYAELIPIGYPRLYTTWLDRIRETARSYIEMEYKEISLQSRNRGVSLFLGSTVPDLFSAQELEAWMHAALESLLLSMPETPVHIKPHPVEKPHVLDMVKQVTSMHPLARVTFLHPSILAAESRLVVAYHTSTIIDSMALGVPTIQFQEFTPHWLKIHPEGSSFLKLGCLWAQNKEELVAHINRAISADYKTPDVRPVLRHRENLSQLFEGGA